MRARYRPDDQWLADRRFLKWLKSATMLDLVKWSNGPGRAATTWRLVALQRELSRRR